MSIIGEIHILIRSVLQTEKVPPSEIYVTEPILADLRKELDVPEPAPVTLQCIMQEIKILPMSAYPGGEKR